MDKFSGLLYNFGTMLISELIRVKMLNLRDNITDWLVRRNFSPNQLTLIGLFINFCAGASFAFGNYPLGALLIIFAGAFDVLDGSVAKKSNRVTKFGAFFDSTIDRYSDMMLYGGIIIHFLLIDEPLFAAFGVSALIGAQLVSYSRAKAEHFIKKCDPGFWQRPERTVYLIIGAFAGNLALVMLIEAFAIHTTVIRRIILAREEISKLDKGPAPETPELLNIFYALIFWDFKRYTFTYDLVVLLLAILPFIIRPF